MELASSTYLGETIDGLNAPTVTVVVPCFRRGDLLRECLESVVGQHLQDWETVVIDDGTPSTEVEDTVKQLRDQRIRYVRHPKNLGLAAARNTGYRQARARLILPLDSDDRLHPAFLETTTKAFREDQAADCVYTDFQLFGRYENVQPWDVRTLEDMLRFQWIPGPGTLQRKSIWEGVGGYCEPPTMTPECEWDFWIGACTRGMKAVHIPKPLYWYRVHTDTMSATALSREAEQREAIYRRHKATIDAFGLGPRFRATGYANSARGALRIGRRSHAIGLALRGLRLDPSNEEAWRQLTIASLPGSFVERIDERFVDPSNARLWRQLAVASLPARLVERIRGRHIADAIRTRERRDRVDL